MHTWLRGRFAWRFSLRRLVIAVVFLGAFMGLNFRMIGPLAVTRVLPANYWGWPLPFNGALDEPTAELSTRFNELGRMTESEKAAFKEYNARRDTADAYRFPWTHQTYRLLDWDKLQWLDAYFFLENERTFRVCSVLDALFALTVLLLTLFLQIPRRQTPAEGEGRP